MEKKLVKSAIYGFVLGIFLAILFIPEVRTIPVVNGGITTYEVPMKEYVFLVLRFAIKMSLSALIAAAIVAWLRTRGYQVSEWLNGAAKSFVLTFVFTLLVMLAFGVFLG